MQSCAREHVITVKLKGKRTPGFCLCLCPVSGCVIGTGRQCGPIKELQAFAWNSGPRPRASLCTAGTRPKFQVRAVKAGALICLLGLGAPTRDRQVPTVPYMYLYCCMCIAYRRYIRALFASTRTLHDTETKIVWIPTGILLLVCWGFGAAIMPNYTIAAFFPPPCSCANAASSGPQ